MQDPAQEDGDVCELASREYRRVLQETLVSFGSKALSVGLTLSNDRLDPETSPVGVGDSVTDPCHVVPHIRKRADDINVQSDLWNRHICPRKRLREPPKRRS